MEEKIICAAIWYPNYPNKDNLPSNIDSGLVIYGLRHHNCIFIYWHFTKQQTEPNNSIQGFITNKDRFVGRHEAANIAFAAKQTEKQLDILYSEDIY